MVICLRWGAELHMAQMMPLPLTVSCFSKIQIGITFLVLAHPGNPGHSPEGHKMGVCVCWISLMYWAFCSYSCDRTKSEVVTSLAELEPNPNWELAKLKLIPNPNCINDWTKLNPNLHCWVRFLSLVCIPKYYMQKVKCKEVKVFW